MYRRGEVGTLILAGLMALVAAATLLTTTLTREEQDVRTEASTGSCPFDSGQNIPLGRTESNAGNMENRWPISQHRHEYDILGPGYFVLQPNNDDGILSLTKNDGGAVDANMNNFMGSILGYKPKRLVAALNVAYGGSVPRGEDTQIKGDAPVLQIPTDPGADVRMPQTGYDIGEGNEAMVVFAANDRITLHIGRHEYFVGRTNGCGGRPCSGGYWIYIKDICVDAKILGAYNSVKGQQESAGADKNPIQLPMVRAGQVLGKATGQSIIVGVRDNGPFISTFKPVYWGGVPEREFGAAPQPTTPPAVNPPTNTPNPTQTPRPTATAGATATPTPTCAVGRPYRCPGTNTCVPVAAECESVPTNTPTPTPQNTNAPTPPAAVTPTQTPVPGAATPTPPPGATFTPTPPSTLPTPTSAPAGTTPRTVRTSTEIDTQGKILTIPGGKIGIQINPL